MVDNINPEKQSEKPLTNSSFKLFQPVQPGPPSFNFWTQQNELSEMLTRNSVHVPSFKLQQSIINVAAFKEAEKPSISDFSTHLSSGGRGRKPKTPRSTINMVKKVSSIKINKFEVEKPVETALELTNATDARIYDNNDLEADTEIKRQIKAHQFDSEVEEIQEFFPLVPDFKADLCFVDKNHVSVISRKISKTSKKLVDLVKFIQKRENDTRDVKTYACKYCPKVFVRRAALGGHTAKNHPHQSDSYRIRQESLKNRRIERERFDYFKTIEQK